jgi:integrase
MIRPLMTWEGSKRRWRKMYKGKIYTVSCEALGCLATKLESYQLANQWWTAKKLEIDGRKPVYVHPVIAEMRQRKDWLISKGLDPSAYEAWTREVEGWQESGDLHPSIVNGLMDSLSPSPEVWRDRIERDQPQPVPQDRTIGFQIGEYLKLLMAKHKAGEIGVDEYELTRGCLEVFKTWIGSDAFIDKLDADKWEAWYKEVLNSKISSAYKHKRFRCAKNFVAWLVTKGRIPGPPNLQARAYRFGASHKEVKPLSVNGVLAIINKAKGVLRLHLMLMANTGMGQKDISDLSPEEIVWEDGRIDRRRSKTKKIKTPYVSWVLWPETWRLLQEYAQKEGDHALLTESGKPWVRKEIVKGKISKSDNIKSLYAHLDIKAPLKMLRKTGASMIKKEFGREVADHWLGHGPKNVSDRAYFAKDQEKLDEAIAG